MHDSNDLVDELKDLVEHLQSMTSSTAVYVGKVVLPIKAITEESDDTAHIDAAAQPQIQFMYASNDHAFLVDKTLKQDQGITYGLFQEAEGDAEKEVPVEEEELDENGDKIVKPKAPVAEKLPKHILVDQVVREPKMHYYTVPRLGSYLAIKLEYDSCLFEEAFD